MVLIRHGSYISVYSNLKEFSVAVGDKVSAQQPIGKVNDDGILHFQLRNENSILNPREWLMLKQRSHCNLYWHSIVKSVHCHLATVLNFSKQWLNSIRGCLNLYRQTFLPYKKVGFSVFRRGHCRLCNLRKIMKQTVLSIKNGEISSLHKKIIFRNLNCFLFCCNFAVA